MLFKTLCVLLLLTKVASALEGLKPIVAHHLYSLLIPDDVNLPPSGGLMNQNAVSSSEINTNSSSNVSKDDVIMHSPRDLPTSDIECELEELEEEVRSDVLIVL